MVNEFHDVAHAAEFLHTVNPFNLLDTPGLQRLSAKLEAAYFPQGKIIFRSQPPPGLAIIRKGAVRLMDDTHRFLDKRSEGEIFGHAIYFHGVLKEYVAEAEEDCLLWVLGVADFAALCESDQRIAAYFSSQLQARLNEAIEVEHSVTKVRDLLKRAPVKVNHSLSIRSAAQKMSAEDVSSVLVMKSGRLVGIVTDKDLRQRVLARGLSFDNPIERVMTQNPTHLDADAGVDTALLLMMRENYHHLPILEQDKPLGLVTAGDILRAQSEHPLRVVRDIYKKTSIEELVVLSRRLPPLFERMVNLGRDVEQIGRMVTLVTDSFTIRLIRLAEMKLGKPPLKYAWVAFGSQAREEQSARTDQDNGMILERDANEREAAYFSKLADMVCSGLDELGYVFCPGEVMALNVKWRVSLERWKRHFDRWIDQPEPKSVMHSTIFFDIRCIYGHRRLVNKLQDHASRRAQGNRIFLRFMAENALGNRPPLGFFRRFVQEDDGTHSEGLNLKHRGIVPITDLVRIRALESGIREANTFRRIEFARDSGVMNANDARSLRDALKLISKIRLVHQSAQLAAGEKPTNFVPTEDLSPLMRRNLKAAFMLVLEAQNALALRYQVL